MESGVWDNELAHRGATAIRDGFAVYHTHFKKIAQRAKVRFETQDWHGGQQDSIERLDLYKNVIDMTVGIIHAILGPETRNRSVWTAMKPCYSQLIAERNDIELAETFFNSVTRRIFTTVGVDPHIEFVASGPRPGPRNGGPPYCVFQHANAHELTQAILAHYPFQCGYHNRGEDIRLVAEAIERHIATEFPTQRILAVEMLKSVFYRNKGAYLVGRIRLDHDTLPLLLPLLNTGQGVFVDTALLTEDDALMVFGYTRSYFTVEAERPAAIVTFLKTLMPRKSMAELYTSIGYNKHGKTKLYRDLVEHLTQSNDRFETAPGTKGMVMAVFTLPSFDVVFKIIKDRFAYPKTSNRDEVKERYQLVFRHDRAGRLIDAQEFEHLGFDKARFSDDLLEELLSVAAQTVSVQGDQVIIKHLYTERRVTPLNLYIQQADQTAAAEAVIDYGAAVKDLAATNIFPGDLFLKNFGVTRHQRVVFYDYDELCLLTDCHFRRMPHSDRDDEEMGQEPWFSVADNDIFPEQFRMFLGLQGPLLEVFLAHHRDLLDVEFWQAMQARHDRGDFVDIFPYKQTKRFRVSS